MEIHRQQGEGDAASNRSEGARLQGVARRRNRGPEETDEILDAGLDAWADAKFDTSDLKAVCGWANSKAKVALAADSMRDLQASRSEKQENEKEVRRREFQAQREAIDAELSGLSTKKAA